MDALKVKPDKQAMIDPLFLVEWIKQQKPDIQEMFKNDRKGLKNYLLKQIYLRQKKFPCHGFVPNIAQERATKCYEKRNPITNNFPKYMIFTGGNGVGKTCSMAMLIAGCSYGKEYLNSKYYDYEYFDEVAEIRRNRPFAIRIICDKSDTEENGSVYQQIRKWIPLAKWSGKMDNHYTKITIEHPEKSKYGKVVIDIKTHNMDIVSFSGSDCDLVIFNEPIKNKAKFMESVSRLRMGGRIAMFLTPLKGVAYLHKMIHDPRNRNRLYHSKGAIWDNCKDIEGTRGVLTKENIDDLIAAWRDDPVTLKARELGEFVFLEGAVFVRYNSQVHVEEPEQAIPPKWNMIQIVDPHPSKSDVSVWMALDPLNTWRVVAEYPIEPWDELGNSEKTISMFGYDFKLIESGKVGKFRYMRGMPTIAEGKRIGDPNAFETRQSHNKKTIQWQYNEDCGLHYNTNVDNSIDLRHDKIKNLLYYDPERKLDSANFPKLLIWSGCYNVQMAFINYALGDNQKPLEEWKDWIDAVGYGVTTVDCWEHQAPNNSENHYTNEYMEIERGMQHSIEECDMSPIGTEVVF